MPHPLAGWAASAAALPGVEGVLTTPAKEPTADPGAWWKTVRLERRHQILVAIVLAAALIATSVAIALSRGIQHAEYAKADARLAAELAGAVRAVDMLGVDARARAVRLAARPDVQRALAAGDTRRLRAIAARARGVGFEAGGRRVAGPPRPGALGVPAAVVADGSVIGRVVVEVTVEAVAAGTALATGDRLVAGRVDPLAPSPRTVEVDGRRYRAVSTAGGPVRITALAPHGPIAAAVADRRRRVVLALLASFASVVLLASLAVWFGRPSTRRLRRTGDEPPFVRGGQRERQSATLVGNVLAAGHDVDALLPVILECAVAITGAASAHLVADGDEHAGAVDGSGPPLSIALTAGPSAGGGLLVLYPPRGGGFDDEAVQLAEWLAGRASIAFQNAHLHRLARRLASTDELTQLANRRQFDEALAAEIVRAERFNDPVAVVVADLDNFKEINDRFGHDVGDLVLRAFAAAIRANVRDVDLPARYGGEEFTVLLPATDAEGACQLAERLRLAAEELEIDFGGDAVVRLTSSFGVASFPDEPSAAALMRAGDRALYRAKAAGKNAVLVAEATTASIS